MVFPYHPNITTPPTLWQCFVSERGSINGKSNVSKKSKGLDQTQTHARKCSSKWGVAPTNCEHLHEPSPTTGQFSHAFDSALALFSLQSSVWGRGVLGYFHEREVVR
eukprot:1248693-Amphidinium_carterae.1